LSNFAPWAIPPLLMLGGAYLCFEGAEKVAHVTGWAGGGHGHEDYPDADQEPQDPAHLEEKKARGAIKTDFILSAEIMTIALAAIPKSNVVTEAATLAAVAIMITVAVYGAVALIVKADDLGLAMAKNGTREATRALGRGIVQAMPHVLHWLTVIGTAAMLWVGGSIIVHGLHQLGAHAPYEIIHALAGGFAHVVPQSISGVVEWIFTAAGDGALGLVVGFALIPLGERVITPLWRRAVAFDLDSLGSGRR
jgi:predicted DNA repair protein MutK